MNLRHSVKWILMGVLAMPGLSACSIFGGDEEETEEVEASEDENVANTAGAETAEGNAAEGNTAFEEGAAATPSNDIPAELLNAENPAAATADTALAAEGAPTDAAPVDAAALPADANANAAPAAAAAVAAVLPSGTSRVFYVNVATATLHNGPSASAQSVGRLSKGDPVLVQVEGAWANVLNRGYVEVASLSEAPVGRSSAGAKSWK